MATVTTKKLKNGLNVIRGDFRLEDVTGLGANTTGSLTVGVLPKGAIPIAHRIVNKGTAAATLSTLTATIGTESSTFANIAAAQTIFAANAGGVGAPKATCPNLTAETTVKTLLTGSGNLSGCTGLDDGFFIEVWYIDGPAAA